MLKRLLGYLSSDLAVDLGTANTLISVAGEGLVLDEPSVVAVRQETGRVLSGGCAVGHLARQMLGRTPGSISVVRPLSAGVITDFELCEAMLGYFFRKARPPGPRLRPRVVVAVPGGITPVEKRAVFNSTQRAGARQVFVLPKAKAAAIGAGLPVEEPVASMVCDIGGGTTEVAVTSLGEVVAGRSIRTGGDCMDQAVVDYLRRHFSLRIGLAAAEHLRIEIGNAYSSEKEPAAEVRGLDTATGLPRKATITGEELREALADPLQTILEAVKQTLDRLPPDLAADLMDTGLLLSGGGSLTRGIDRFLAHETGLPVRVAPEPLSTVAKGTLICLEHLDRWRPALESSDDDV
ncbi:MAG: rod shape-determining protein [Planctomycetota bacterium]